MSYRGKEHYISKKIRTLIYERDNYICQKCGQTKKEYFWLHHKKPVYLGGLTLPCNLVTLCSLCNSLAPDDWKEYLVWIKNKGFPFPEKINLKLREIIRKYIKICEKENPNITSDEILIKFKESLIY